MMLSPSSSHNKATPNMVSFNLNSSKNLTRDQEDLLDAKTIFKYKAIIKLRPDIPIVTEMVSPENLGFIISSPKDYATMKKYGYTQVI